MSEQTPAAAAPGWYPDQNGHQRWWDGTQWTDHVQAPYDPATRALELKAPEGTKTGTVWIWLIVFLPLVGIIPLLTIDWAAYIDTAIQQSSAQIGYGTSGLYGTPADLISNLVTFAVYGITVGLAALDVRALKQRGVQQPFHWAFAFLTSTVYVIGRSVVVKRRTGGGLAPLWVWIVLNVLIFIGAIIFASLIFQYMMAAFPLGTIR